MCSFQYASDLHLEINQCKFSDILSPSADYLILAGDIGYPESQIYVDFLTWCSVNFKQTFIITGNHEYYSSTNHKTMTEIEAIISTICESLVNVIFLNKTSYVIENKIKILGCTLWSNILPTEFFYVKKYMNDYKYIYLEKNNLLKPSDSNFLHKNSVEWLEQNLIEDSYINIVLTHHLPTPKLIDPKYYKCNGNSAFYTDLESLIKKSKINYWICGHTHVSVNKNLYCTNLLVNSYGYQDYDTDTGYKPDATFKI